MIGDAEARAWLSAELAKQGVRDLAILLRPLGARLLVIKGTHLSLLARTPWRRSMVDADVVLLDCTTAAAVRTCVDAGWVVRGSALGAVPLTSPTGQYVDLHIAALPPFFGCLRTESLVSHAAAAPSMGPNVLQPDRIDGAIIAMAKFVEDRLGIEGRPLAPDLQILMEDGTVDLTELRLRLAEAKLRFTAVLALTSIQGLFRGGDEILTALRPTRAELLRAALVAPVLRHGIGLDPNWILIRLCTDDPRDALYGGTYRLAAAVKRRWQMLID